MAKQIINTNAPSDLINVGSTANAKNGDPLRSAFIKINDALDRIDSNFTELYNSVGADVQIPAQTNNGGKYLTTNGTTLSWANITDDDSSYVTNSSLTTTLNSYALSSSIPTALSDLTNDSNFLIKDTAPSTLAGAEGDTAGTVAFDNNYIYYCTSNYTSVGAGGATVTLVPNELGQSVNTITIAKGAPPNTAWATPQVNWTLTVNSTTVTIEEITNDITNVYIVVSGFINLPPTGNITFTEPGGVQPNIWVRQAWGVTNLNIVDGGNATTF